MTKINFPELTHYSTPFTVLLDMDGVVANWIDPTCRVCGLDVKNAKIRSIFNKDSVKVNNDIPDFESKIEEAGYNFWRTLPLLPWAKGLYHTMTQFAQVAFLTSPTTFSQCYHAKREWVKQHFDSEKVVLTTEKYLCASPWRYLIDDSLDNVKAFKSHGGHAYHWPNYIDIVDNKRNIDMITENIINDIKRLKLKLGQ